jgi:hypothetical protein
MTDTKIPFSRIFWPTLVAIGIALSLGLVFFFLILGGIIGSFSEFGPEPYAVENKSILHVSYHKSITMMLLWCLPVVQKEASKKKMLKMGQVSGSRSDRMRTYGHQK